MAFIREGRTLETGSGRRSVVLGRRGMVATSQPLAAWEGLRVLQEGGNAVDAAVTMSATLSVVEPHMTGPGGDLVALVYAGATGRVHCLDAAGRAPARATPEAVRQRGVETIPPRSGLAVTVPGAVSGWAALLERFGKIDLRRALEPAIAYAEDGFPVTEVIAAQWAASEGLLRCRPAAAAAYLIGGRAPRTGEVFCNPDLGRTLRILAARGAEVFYRGELGEAIAACVQGEGGLLDPGDLAGHVPSWVDPIWSSYRGCTVLQAPPSFQGVTALEILNILEAFDLRANGHNSAGSLHVMIEAKKLAFADRHRYLADPTWTDVPVARLLSKAYARRRARLIGDRASAYAAGPLDAETETVVAVAADGSGNAVVLLSSLFNPFGSGIVVEGTGVVLQNRGAGFSLDPRDRNAIGPAKRPLHTLAPCMVLEEDELVLALGVMGGDMQVQGHAQVLANLVDFDLPLQEAVDAPRVRHLEGGRVYLDAGIAADAEAELKARGHEVERDGLPATTTSGGAQAVAIDRRTRVLAGASDWRKDGCAAGF
jgi:gamma-glutamyltranspeptidase/glutathione hydrolase